GAQTRGRSCWACSLPHLAGLVLSPRHWVLASLMASDALSPSCFAKARAKPHRHRVQPVRLLLQRDQELSSAGRWVVVIASLGAEKYGVSAGPEKRAGGARCEQRHGLRPWQKHGHLSTLWGHSPGTGSCRVWASRMGEQAELSLVHDRRR